MTDHPATEPAPFLSVIVAAYNSEQTIAETIDSVTGQTRGDLELIIVDDGSTDSTAEIVAQRGADDPRIRLIRQPNAGTAMARNSGAAYARGAFWVFLDADDMLRPDYYESQEAFIAEHPGFDIYSCNAEYLLRSGARRPVWQGRRFEKPFSLRAEDQFAESSILLMAAIKPRVFEMTDGFRTLHSEDYDFWLRALILGARHIYNPAVLAVYRRSEGSRTRSLVAEAESFLQIQREALAMAELSQDQRAVGRRAVEFSEARVLRRELEEALLAADVAHARARYWRARAAFPSKIKYVIGLALMMASPRLYAGLKRERML